MPMPEKFEQKLTAHIKDIGYPLENQKHIRQGARWAYENTASEELVNALELAKEHLEFCGYGDRYERDIAIESKLHETIEAALTKAKAL